MVAVAMEEPLIDGVWNQPKGLPFYSGILVVLVVLVVVVVVYFRTEVRRVGQIERARGSLHLD